MVRIFINQNVVKVLTINYELDINWLIIEIVILVHLIYQIYHNFVEVSPLRILGNLSTNLQYSYAYEFICGIRI